MLLALTAVLLSGALHSQTVLSGNAKLAGAGVLGSVPAAAGGDTFIQDVTIDQDNGVNKAQAAIYRASNISAGTTLVTANITGGSSLMTVQVLELAGVDPSSPVDITASHGGVTTPAFSCGTATTTNADDFVIGSAAVAAGNTITMGVDTGYTVPSNGSQLDGLASGVGTGEVEYKITSSTGSQTPHFNISINTSGAGLLVAYKKATGGTLSIVNSQINSGSGNVSSVSVTIPPTTGGNTLVVSVWLHPATGSSTVFNGVVDQ